MCTSAQKNSELFFSKRNMDFSFLRKSHQLALFGIAPRRRSFHKRSSPSTPFQQLFASRRDGASLKGAVDQTAISGGRCAQSHGGCGWVWEA